MYMSCLNVTKALNKISLKHMGHLLILYKIKISRISLKLIKKRFKSIQIYKTLRRKKSQEKFQTINRFLKNQLIH